jgi:pantetheine-phosphate adenylyltransferase
MQVKAIYAGTFDPITNGHIDIIKRSMSFCSQLIIAIGINPAKKTMFTNEERVSLINRSIEKELDFLTSTNVTAVSFNGLLVDYAREDGANILVRGIRSVSDFEYEINLANINKTLAPHIETVFLPTSPELAVVSSSMVKEIARYGGDIRRFVPEVVAGALYAKLNNEPK